MTLDVRAMLITAGFGTRLAPLTDLLPKPAVPVANRPLAWFALDHLYRSGVRDLVLNTHHLAPALEREVLRFAPADLRLRFVFEPEILGTGGGVRNAWARPAPGETFLVMNGKVLFAPDLEAALRAHREQNALATMVLTHAPGVRGFGDVEIDAAGWVRRLRRAPPRPEGAPELRPMFYTGVSLLSDRAFADLPENGCLIGDAYQHWVDRGERVLGVVDAGTCRDAGMSLWHYWEANQALLTGEVKWPGIAVSADGVVRDAGMVLGEGARVVRSAIGSDVSIAPGVRVSDAVVWPGARIGSDVARAIVLPDGRQLAITS
ncbi:MAG TPA: NDP-sugar synthase [Polyangiales bacterium]|nr:NDP-sugar synthase [Polyangiales bacterium]